MILVAGSANLDFVVRAPRIPAPGETVLGYGFETFPGGKGANQAIACARGGGAATAMLLALGNDAFAVPLEDSLVSAGVKIHVVRIADASTGTAFICVSDQGENSITVAPGANGGLSPSHLPSLDNVTHLLMQLEIPLETVIAYAHAARKRGVEVVLNAAPARALPPELLAAIDVLIVNEGELATIVGPADDLLESLARLEVRNVVVTLGPRGSRARIAGASLIQQAFGIDVVDTTAAGDTFCGVLVAALGRGLDWESALRQASAAGALACTRLGAQTSIPTQIEVLEFLHRHARIAH
ncbi:MAG: ribokinase [Pseudomonadota bacterium]|nr:ribokinase [Pseudomonadota bacterium]